MCDGASKGRMEAASFAMTPASGYTPATGQPWYTADTSAPGHGGTSYLPSSRALSVYDDTAGGQLLDLNYYWNVWNGTGYSANNFCGYSDQYNFGDSADPATLLKTGPTLNDFNPHSESYSYDPSLDYLTQAANAGNDGVTENWAYDPAGNRHDTGSGFSQWTFDNLNRLTASPGLTYSNDILGNRLSNSATSNGWDQLNRMTSFTDASSNTTNYSYRSDGMRVQKSASSSSTSFAYDGQMGFEDVETGGNNPGVSDYAIGPRGLDRIAFTNGSNTTIAYPVYDGHGNMTCTLTASNGSFSAANNERQYDAWGGVAYGQGSQDPKGRYCASLGHKQDDESGLIYMRARYDDPTTGRFISEDPELQSANLFSYCSQCPTMGADPSGKDGFSLQDATEILYKILNSWGLDPSCLKIAGVALVMAALLTTLGKLDALATAGQEEIQLGILLMTGAGTSAVGAMLGLTAVASGAVTVAISVAFTALAIYQAVLEVDVILAEDGD